MEMYKSIHSSRITTFEGVCNGMFVLTTPNGVDCLIFGGPYVNKPNSNIVGVKMAEEINLPCDIDIPTSDFSVPDVQVFRRGLIKAIVNISKGNSLYIGCMGGIGRTGLFIAALLRIYNPSEDPVYLTRLMYLRNAVETQEQKTYILNLPIVDLVRLAELS